MSNTLLFFISLRTNYWHHGRRQSDKRKQAVKKRPVFCILIFTNNQIILGVENWLSVQNWPPYYTACALIPNSPLVIPARQHSLRPKKGKTIKRVVTWAQRHLHPVWRFHASVGKFKTIPIGKQSNYHLASLQCDWTEVADDNAGCLLLLAWLYVTRKHPLEASHWHNDKWNNMCFLALVTSVSQIVRLAHKKRSLNLNSNSNLTMTLTWLLIGKGKKMEKCLIYSAS